MSHTRNCSRLHLHVVAPLLVLACSAAAGALDDDSSAVQRATLRSSVHLEAPDSVCLYEVVEIKTTLPKALAVQTRLSVRGNAGVLVEQPVLGDMAHLLHSPALQCAGGAPGAKCKLALASAMVVEDRLVFDFTASTAMCGI